MDAQRKNLLKGVLLGTALGVLLQVGGYLLVRGARTEFGWAMFLVVPFVSGFAVAAVVRRAKRILACRVERPFRSVQQQEVFNTETAVAATPKRTWDLVAEMHKLDGPRPFLLRCGLPTPTRCELDLAGVGGRRVCYFDSGIIAQEVTAWERPTFMGLRVTESTLPGRRWLTFVDASYELSAVGAQTRVVRHTTIGTRLYPRSYWRPLERWGVISEHEFVFANLRRWTEQQ